MQHHYVVYWDSQKKMFVLDLGTTTAKFDDGSVYDTDKEKWFTPEENSKEDEEDFYTYLKLLDLITENPDDLG